MVVSCKAFGRGIEEMGNPLFTFVNLCLYSFILLIARKKTDSMYQTFKLTDSLFLFLFHFLSFYKDYCIDTPTFNQSLSLFSRIKYSNPLSLLPAINGLGQLLPLSLSLSGLILKILVLGRLLRWVLFLNFLWALYSTEGLMVIQCFSLPISCCVAFGVLKFFQQNKVWGGVIFLLTIKKSTAVFLWVFFFYLGFDSIDCFDSFKSVSVPGLCFD